MFLILLDHVLTKSPHAMMNLKLQNKMKWIKACEVNNEWSWSPSITYIHLILEISLEGRIGVILVLY